VIRSLWSYGVLRGDPVQVIFMSGRPEECRTQTELWLDANVGLPFQLHMRSDGDFRQDWIIKDVVPDFDVEDVWALPVEGGADDELSSVRRRGRFLRHSQAAAQTRAPYSTRSAQAGTTQSTLSSCQTTYVLRMETVQIASGIVSRVTRNGASQTRYQG